MITAAVYFLVLGALIKLLLATEKPMLCAVLFALMLALFTFLMEAPLLVIAIVFCINLAYAWLYFWLLNRLQGTSLFWLVLIGGILLRSGVGMVLH